MFRIQNEIENTIIIQKSEFITHLYRVESINDVNAILEATKKKYYDATHNCYAYIIGDNQDIQKCSDDGEPQKTAGAPMMDVLKKNNMTNILAIVTRYFGGILLGAGGLVRAYSSSVAEALSKAKLYTTLEVVDFMITTSYSGYNSILNIKNINITNTSFTDSVIITGYIKKDLFNQLNEILYKNKIDPEALKKIGDSLKEIPIE
ncbi:MAG: YigZ family protein [Acholeplasmatales bacterium]|nr:YigZ family protein [Acholeplasmatales bacterium]